MLMRVHRVGDCHLLAGRAVQVSIALIRHAASTAALHMAVAVPAHTSHRVRVDSVN